MAPLPRIPHHLASYARFRAHREQRERSDARAMSELAVEVTPQRPYELGPFTVTFVPSLHSKLLLGLAVPFDGELTCEHLDALSPAAYRCGQVWGIHIEVAGMSFYHQGSANLIDDA